MKLSWEYPIDRLLAKGAGPSYRLTASGADVAQYGYLKGYAGPVVC